MDEYYPSGRPRRKLPPIAPPGAELPPLPGSAEARKRRAAEPRLDRATRHGRTGLQTYDRRAARVYTGHRRRTGGGGPALLAMLVLAVLIAVAAWVLTRSAAASVTVVPADAQVVLGDLPAHSGNLLAEGLRPGEYPVRVTRTGFEPLSTTLRVRRGRTAEATYRLKPRRFAFTLAPQPPTATWRLTGADGEPRTGNGRLSLELPAGPLDITLEAPGYAKLERRVFLDRALTLDARMDPPGQLVRSLALVPSGRSPKALRLSPDGRSMWVALLGGRPALEVYDRETGARTAEVSLGGYGAADVAFSPDGTYVYASQMETARVFEIEAATRKVVRTFATGGALSKTLLASADGRTLWVANWSGGDVSEIDVGSGRVRRRLKTVDTPRGLWESADGKRLYVAGYGKGELDRIDLKTGARRVVFRSGGSLLGLAGSAGGATVYISDARNDVVWAHDVKTGRTRRLAATDRAPNTLEVTPDGKVVAVSSRGKDGERGSVLLFDAASGRSLDAVVGGHECGGLDLSADGKVLAFADLGDDRLRVHAVPGYKTLAAGKGGRSGSYRADLRR